MKTHILRKVRIILAAIMFIGITLMFMDFTGALHKWLGWMAKIQFLPALLAVNTVIIAGLLLLIAFLAADFWLTIGVVGALYILTVPVTCFIFLKVKSRYLKNVGGALDAVSPKV